MLLGAMVDLHALTGHKEYLHVGIKVLDAVIARMTSDDGKLVLREAVGLKLQGNKCDSSHDPSSPAGGDLYSFKAIFMQQLPRFLRATTHLLSPAQLVAARRMVSDSADAAWQTRVVPPFPQSDICNEYRGSTPPSGGAPKFTWNWRPVPAANEWTCMDARTQAQALSVFVADLELAQHAEEHDNLHAA